MGLQVLARWPGLGRLTYLNVRDNHIGDLGVSDFLASPYRGSLEVLDLGANDYSDEAAAALKAACEESGDVRVYIDRPVPHRQLLQ